MNILKYIIHRIIFRYGLTKIFTRLPFIRDTCYYVTKNRLSIDLSTNYSHAPLSSEVDSRCSVYSDLFGYRGTY